MLDREAQHRTFDMQQYGKEIIEVLPVPKAGKPRAVAFTEVATGVEPFEICRRFAAVLQLANSGHVDIRPSESSDVFQLALVKAKTDPPAPVPDLQPVLRTTAQRVQAAC